MDNISIYDLKERVREIENEIARLRMKKEALSARFFILKILNVFQKGMFLKAN